MSDLLIRLVVASGFALLTVAAPAQVLLPAASPLAPFQEALLRGDFDDARAGLDALLFSVDAPTARELEPRVALLRAAAEPIPRRPRAMLEVARAYADQPVADVALAAGLSALLADNQSYSDLFEPFLGAATDAAASAPMDEPGVASTTDGGTAAETSNLVAAFTEVLRRRTAERNADLGALDQARRCLAEFPGDRLAWIRVRSGVAIPIPSPLAEPVMIRVFRLGPDQSWWRATDVIAPSRAPILTLNLERESPLAPLPPLAPGAYALELRSPLTGHSRTRPLLVSDLDLVAHVTPGGLAILATLDGAPAAGVRLRITTDASTTDGARPGDGPLPAPQDGVTTEAGIWFGAASPRHTWITAEAGEHRAAMPIVVDNVAPPTLPTAVAHAWFDRPTHGPGDVVKGRVMAWAVNAIPPDVTDRAWALGPAAHVSITLTCFPRQPQAIVIDGITDEHGELPFEFTLPATTPPGNARVRVQIARDGHGTAEADTVLDFVGFAVRETARGAVVVDARAPATWRPGDADPVVDISAHLGSGALLGGLSGTLTATLGGYRETQDITFNADGTARATLALGGRDRAMLRRFDRVNLAVAVHGSDRASAAWTGIIRLESWPTAGDPEQLEIEGLEGDPIAGQPLPISLHGRPGSLVLLTAARQGPLGTTSAVLDDAGNARVVFDTDARWWPRVVIAATCARDQRDSRTGRAARAGVLDLAPDATHVVEFALQEGPLRCRIEGLPAAVQPGQEISLTVLVESGPGRPANSRVALSIVDAPPSDETFPDDPQAMLRPALRPSRVRTYVARLPLRTARVLGEMLRGGLVPSPGDSLDFAPPNGDDSPRLPPERPRPRPRPVPRGAPGETIFFAAGADADAAGQATFRVRVPDRSGRFQISALAFTPRGASGTATLVLDTAGEVAVQAAFRPSFVRPGDQVTLAVDIGPDRRAPRDLAVDVVGAAAAAPLTLHLGVGETTHVPLPLVVEGGTTVQVRVRTPNGQIAGTWSWALPIATDPGAGPRRHFAVNGTQPPLGTGEPFDVDATLDLINGVDGLAAAAAIHLRELREPTADGAAARLLAALAIPDRQGDGPTARAAATVFAAELRGLRSGDGYFRFAHGATDFALTPGVIHALALAREFGFEPDRSDAAPDFRDGFPRLASRVFSDHAGNAAAALQGEEIQEFTAWRDRVPAVDRETTLATYALAAFEYDPHGNYAREAVSTFLRQASQLPPGLLAFGARIIGRAGDAEIPRRAWERLQSGEVAASIVRPAWLESRTARAAHRLELGLAVAVDDAERLRLKTELAAALAAEPDGDRLARAFAIAALVHESRAHPVSSSTARVTIDGGGEPRRDLALPARAIDRQPLSAGARAGGFTVRTAEGGPVFASLSRSWQSAEGLPPAAQPLHVTRRAGTATDLLTPGDDLDPTHALRVAAGDTFEIVTTVTGMKEGSPYLIECPIPSCCDLLQCDPPPSVVDDRVVVALEAAPEGGVQRITARFVATVAGESRWPPTLAWALDRPEMFGAGSWSRAIIAAPAPARDAALPVTLLAGDAIARARDALVLGISHEMDLAALRRLIDTLATIPDQGVGTALLPVLPSLGDKLRNPDLLVPLVMALGPQRAELLSGASIAAVIGEPASSELIAPLAAAVAGTAEGHSLAERWRLGDATLSPAQHRLAGLIALERLAGVGVAALAEFDPLVVTRALDEARRPSAPPALLAERLERALALQYADAFEFNLQTTLGIDATAGSPTAAATETIARWQALVDLAAEQLTTTPDDPRWARLAIAVSSAVVRPPFGARGPRALDELVIAAGTLHERAADRLTDLLVRGLLDPGEFPTDTAIDGTTGGTRRVETIVTWARRPAALNGRAADLALSILTRVRGRVRINTPLGGALATIAAQSAANWALAALGALDPRDRARLPSAILMRRLHERESASTALEFILERADRAELLRTALREDLPRDIVDDVLTGLIRVHGSPFDGLPVERLVRLMPNLSQVRLEALDAELARRAAVDPESIAAWLPRITDARARDPLLRALGDAGFVAVPWNADDPDQDRAAVLLRARAGDPEAGSKLREWLQTATQKEGTVGEDEQLRWWGHLAAWATPRDVQRFGRLQDGRRLVEAARRWSDDVVRAYLSSADACPDPAIETTDRGTAVDVLQLLDAGRKTRLGPAILDLWSRWHRTQPARDQVALFANLGEAQAVAITELLGREPTDAESRAETSPESRYAPLDPRDLTAFVAALEPRADLWPAVRQVVLTRAPDEARRLFAQRWLEVRGTAITFRTIAGETVVVAPQSAADWRRAVRARLRVEGLTSARVAEPSAIVALREILVARGVFIP